MTSKLKCPFCQQELRQDYTGVMYCYNEDCEQSADWFGSSSLWQALIQSQQDLEESQQATLENAQTVLEIHKDLDIARQALEFVKTLNERQDGCFEEDYETQMRTVYKALKQIEQRNRDGIAI